jgi:hypothetical protein
VHAGHPGAPTRSTARNDCARLWPRWPPARSPCTARSTRRSSSSSRPSPAGRERSAAARGDIDIHSEADQLTVPPAEGLGAGRNQPSGPCRGGGGAGRLPGVHPHPHGGPYDVPHCPRARRPPLGGGRGPGARARVSRVQRRTRCSDRILALPDPDGDEPRELGRLEHRRAADDRGRHLGTTTAKPPEEITQPAQPTQPTQAGPAAAAITQPKEKLRNGTTCKGKRVRTCVDLPPGQAGQALRHPPRAPASARGRRPAPPWPRTLSWAGFLNGIPQVGKILSVQGHGRPGSELHRDGGLALARA